jgi:hypothetical protein
MATEAHQMYELPSNKIKPQLNPHSGKKSQNVANKLNFYSLIHRHLKRQIQICIRAV